MVGFAKKNKNVGRPESNDTKTIKMFKYIY
jgi:hypothetical protein